MASGLPDVMVNQEAAETSEECSGKKKSKFQTFKNFFAKKKRKEAAVPVNESVLKSSQSSDNVNAPEVTPAHSDADQDSGSKVNMGNKAMSHDSVFVSDSPSSEANDGLASSQDSIHGKVKSLQLQLKQAIKLGSPPSLICVKKGEDAGALSEDDGLPCSPPEISTLHTVLTGSSHRSSNLVQRTSSLSLEGSESEDDQMSLEASSRPVSPLVTLPVDFSQPASPAACLDTSAARHRIAVRHKACAKRKPASREILEGGKVKVLSGRVPLIVKEERLSTVTTEPSAEEKNEDEPMRETEYGEEQEEDAEAAPPASVLPVSQTETEPAIPDEPSKSEAEEQSSAQDLCSSSSSSSSSSSDSETELDAEEALPATDPVPDLQQPLQLAAPLTNLQEFSSSLEPPAGQSTDPLDSECEVPAEEPSSLLQEVLSSLECPMTSAFVLDPNAVALEVNEASTGIESMEEDLTVIPGSLSPASEEEEKGDFAPVSIAYSSPDAPDAELSKEEEPAELEEGDDEEEAAPAESLIEEEEDHSEGSGEAKVEEEEEEEQEEAMLEEVEEESIKKKEEEEAMEEGEAVEDEVEEKEVEAMEEGVEDEEEENDQVVTASEVPLQEVLAYSSEGEEEEEEKDDMRVELAPEIHECMFSEESETAEVDLVSADAVKLLSDDSSDSEQSSTESTECTIELSAQVARDDTCLPLSQAADFDQPAALAPGSTEPDPTTAEPSCNTDVSAEQSTEEPSNVPEDPEKLPDVPEPSKVRFTIAPAWQRSLSGGTYKEPGFTHPIKPEAFEQGPAEPRDLSGKAEVAAASPDRTQSSAPPSIPRQPPSPEANSAENPFGIRLRKTAVLLRYSSEGSGEHPGTTDRVEPMEPPRLPQSGPPSTKPALPKKPDLLDDSLTKLRKTPEPAVSKVPGGTVDSPSWISLAKQKQKSFIENSPEETLERKFPLEKDEALTEGSLPTLTNLSNKEKAKLSGSPVTTSCSLEICKPAAVEKEGKRTLAHSPPAPLGQDEPPWLALAKKKAKAWSEMPQIVQ